MGAGATTEARRREAAAQGRGGCPKNGTSPGTGCDIGFALGDESLHHTDFELPGSMGFAWTRVYNSRLAAYDGGNLGARWITPWTTRLDVEDGALVYHGADGRSHRYPKLAAGERHYDGIEGLELAMGVEGLLTARRGSAVEEIYRYVERPAPHYRLEGVRWKSGSSLGLRYEHERKGSALLSELILKEGGQTVGQLVTRVDTEGRIREIWQVEEQPCSPSSIFCGQGR